MRFTILARSMRYRGMACMSPNLATPIVRWPSPAGRVRAATGRVPDHDASAEMIEYGPDVRRSSGDAPARLGIGAAVPGPGVQDQLQAPLRAGSRHRRAHASSHGVPVWYTSGQLARPAHVGYHARPSAAPICPVGPRRGTWPCPVLARCHWPPSWVSLLQKVARIGFLPSATHLTLRIHVG
jgi:hypothetical protein